ncbi:hypothetical protein GIB67_012414, partial [Kingdonia uniflora]
VESRRHLGETERNDQELLLEKVSILSSIVEARQILSTNKAVEQEFEVMVKAIESAGEEIEKILEANAENKVEKIMDLMNMPSLAVSLRKRQLPSRFDILNSTSLKRSKVDPSHDPAMAMATGSSYLTPVSLQQPLPETNPKVTEVFALDAKDPVKEAFHIMYEHGLAVMPIWDDSKRQFSGMLTASDFILILTDLYKNGSMLTNEELEMHTVSAWKEGKSHLTRELNGPMHPSSGRPLIQAGPLENLKDLALRILHSNISTVPIIHRPEDGSYPQLLYLACLSGILKCMFSLSHYSSVMSIVCFRTVIPFIGHSGCCYSPPVVLFCQINQTFNTSDENDLSINIPRQYLYSKSL